MTIALQDTNTAGDVGIGSLGGRRRLRDNIATIVMWLGFAVAVVPLGFVIYYVTKEGVGIFSWSFLTNRIPIISSKAGPGMGPAVLGTLIITGTATLLAVPLGVLGAVYLNEYGKQAPLAKLIRFMTDVMTGVPSIVMGLFIYTVWVLRFKQSGLAGALALGCLMLPIIVRTSEEMLRLVPDELRQASAALGSSTWRTTTTVVIPAALAGIVSGAMLAIARAAGETAPLLFTIGIVSKKNLSLRGSNTALSAQIFRNAQLPFPAAQERAWGAAFTLILLVFVFTILSRIVAGRFTKR
ncbi:MAG: phosphate transporter, inner rane subunit PstA [Acidimicrobiia bacterium]|nr:phosphate transporter, inner rane subunit PstA [Acidimicrobiia bacterium]